MTKINLLEFQTQASIASKSTSNQASLKLRGVTWQLLLLPKEQDHTLI